MAIDKYSICSTALVMIGGNPITSFAGAGSEEVAAAALYEACVRELLGMYRWRFSSRQVQLSRLDGVPQGTEWEAAYQIPPETLVLHHAAVLGRPIDFDRFEDHLHCNARVEEIVMADITYRSNEAYCPAYFEAVLRNRLASAFAVPVAEDSDKASLYESKFLRGFSAAKNLDAQSRTATKMRGVGGLRRYHGGRP